VSSNTNLSAPPIAFSLTPWEKFLEQFLGDEVNSEPHSSFLTAQIFDGDKRIPIFGLFVALWEASVTLHEGKKTHYKIKYAM
jgi:hypothetical protein